MFLSIISKTRSPTLGVLLTSLTNWVKTIDLHLPPQRLQAFSEFSACNNRLPPTLTFRFSPLFIFSTTFTNYVVCGCLLYDRLSWLTDMAKITANTPLLMYSKISGAIDRRYPSLAFQRNPSLVMTEAGLERVSLFLQNTSSVWYHYLYETHFGSGNRHFAISSCCPKTQISLSRIAPRTIRFLYLSRVASTCGSTCFYRKKILLHARDSLESGIFAISECLSVRVWE